MTTFFLRIGAPLCLLLVAGCQRSGEPAANSVLSAKEQAIAAEKKQIDRIEGGVRLDQAERRIVELEKQVGALRDNPQQLDLDLLTQRVAALEARTYAGGDDKPARATDGNTVDGATPRR